MKSLLEDLIADDPAAFEGKIGLVSFDDAPPDASLAGLFDLAFCTTKRQGEPSAFHWMPCPYSLAWPQVGIHNGEALLQQMLDHEAAPMVDKLFWIGADTHPVRQKLQELALGYPGIMDIELMAWNRQSKDPQLKSQTRYVSLFDHVQFRYLVDLPGFGYSGRLRWLLASGRPVFMIDRPYVEHWHEELLPWIHFVPVKEDLSDLLAAYERIEADEDEDLYLAISSNARQFVRDNLFWEQEKQKILGGLAS